MEVFENQPKDQFATRINMEGDLSDPDAEVFEIFVNILRNAFVEAFRPIIDDEVQFKSAPGN